MNHTPGPWNVAEDNCGGGVNIIDDHSRRVAHTAECYQPKHLGGITSQEAKANARLIAAAPELLAAMESVELDLQKLAFKKSHSPQRLLDLRITLTAAIAKAQGS